MRRQLAKVLAVTAVTALTAMVSVPAVAAPSARGQGTLIVRDTPDCSGTGNASTVVVPFSLYFTGFEPFSQGTVTAYTQPGGDEVGSITATTNANGQLCIRVDGDPAPGQYKIVYEFDDGTGKQKVIRIESAGPTPTPTPTATVTTTPTPTPTPTVSGTPTATVSPTQTATVSPAPTGSGSPTPTASPTDIATPSPSPTPSEDTLVLSVVDLGGGLADTGGVGSARIVPVGVALVVLGAALVLLSRRSHGERGVN